MEFNTIAVSNLSEYAEYANKNFAVLSNRTDYLKEACNYLKKSLGRRTVVGIIFAGYCVYKIKKQRNDIRELRQDVRALKEEQRDILEELEYKRDKDTDDNK